MRAFLLPLILIMLLTGCASTTVTMEFVAIKPVNGLGSADGESRVVEIRIYQLKDDAKFKAATVDALWTNAEETLGEELIEVKLGESIFPEDKAAVVGKEITLDPLASGTKFIGILALFSETDTGERKVVVTLDEADDVLFQLTGYHITVKKD
jgi:type VI secretion system VasD/TssJ family lipoprotein